MRFRHVSRGHETMLGFSARCLSIVAFSGSNAAIGTAVSME